MHQSLVLLYRKCFLFFCVDFPVLVQLVWSQILSSHFYTCSMCALVLYLFMNDINLRFPLLVPAEMLFGILELQWIRT